MLLLCGSTASPLTPSLWPLVELASGSTADILVPLDILHDHLGTVRGTVRDALALLANHAAPLYDGGLCIRIRVWNGRTNAGPASELLEEAMREEVQDRDSERYGSLEVCSSLVAIQDAAGCTCADVKSSRRFPNRHLQISSIARASGATSSLRLRLLSNFSHQHKKYQTIHVRY